jgi:murein DD-endopeptidase MepM/ murein hydrolase activator NlpD
LSRYNGVDPNVPLRRGEVIALPRRVSDQPSVTATQPGAVDISTLAGDAINRAPETSSDGVRVASLPPQEPDVVKAQEPIRHKVERGETAYIIARLYDVPVKSLAEWNGLGPDFAIREGQRLLIPVAKQAPPASAQAAAVTAPGSGSPTPTPPSAAQPLPQEDTKPIVEPAEPVASLSTTAASASAAAMVFPVQGTIIREYSKGKNDGINIKAAPGSPVKAAETGTVAAITQSGEGIPIVVVRHDANLLTVYANVADVSVKKGDSVSRGQTLAKLRDGDDAYVHFEVRKGFDSVDPMPYLQ